MSTYYDPGRYRCEVRQQGMAKASTGTPQFVVVVQPQGIYTGPNEMAGLEKNYDRTVYMALTEKSMPYVAKKLAALGFAGGSLRMLDPNTPGYEDMTGRGVDCICRHGQGKDNQPREEWDIAWESEAREISGDALAPSDYRALDALFGKANGGAPKPAAKPAPAPTPVAAPIATDEGEKFGADVPFF